jgi:hypothetical protein
MYKEHIHYWVAKIPDAPQSCVNINLDSREARPLEHRHIILSTEVLQGQDIWAAFDAQLQAALLANVAGVAVSLAPQMPADMRLLEWLESWQKEFGEVGKEFVIVAEDPRHTQCLEISHPDQNLRYVASVEDLWRTFPAFRPAAPVPEPEVPPAPAAAPVPPAQPLTQAAQKSEPPQPLPGPAHPAVPQEPLPQAVAQEPAQVVQEPAPPLRVKSGELIRASGEYACLGCAATRMYARGDRASACENAECQAPGLGWKLVFELF